MKINISKWSITVGKRFLGDLWTYWLHRIRNGFAWSVFVALHSVVSSDWASLCSIRHLIHAVNTNLKKRDGGLCRAEGTSQRIQHTRRQAPTPEHHTLHWNVPSVIHTNLGYIEMAPKFHVVIFLPLYQHNDYFLYTDTPSIIEIGSYGRYHTLQDDGGHIQRIHLFPTSKVWILIWG